MLRIERILVPIDFSDHAEAALAHAAELAQTHDARLMLLHVLEPPTFPSFYGAGAATLYEHPPNLESRARDALKDLASNVGASQRSVSTHVVQGSAGPSIVAFADERKVDLIVIASLGRTGFKRVLLGSVAERVVRNASCSVFIVKSATSSLVPGHAPVETSTDAEP